MTKLGRKTSRTKKWNQCECWVYSK